MYNVFFYVQDDVYSRVQLFIPSSKHTQIYFDIFRLIAWQRVNVNSYDKVF